MFMTHPTKLFALACSLGTTLAFAQPAYDLPQLAIWHFDFYRFTDPREWEDSGFRDLFTSVGLKLVEWPEKAAGVLPLADWELHLCAADDATRQVRLEAHTAKGAAMLKQMAQMQIGQPACP